MKTKIVNKLNMYHAVVAVCEAHTSDWETIPAFGENYGLFVAKVTQLEQQAYQHTQSLVGVRASKDQERETAIKKAEVIANALRSLGTVSGDTKLNAILRFPHTTLMQSNATRLIQYLDSIIEAAGNHASELPAYGVSPEKLEEMIQLRDQLALTLGAPRNAIVVRKTLTNELDQLIRELDGFLKNNLDALVQVLKADYPAFSELYKAARIVVDHKGKSIKPKNPLPPVAPKE